MSKLTDNVRERTHLTVLSDGEVLTVRSESSWRSIEAQGWVGRTVSVSRSSSGMALLLDHEDEQILEIVRADPQGSRKQAAAFQEGIKLSRQRQYTLANRIFDPEIIGIGTPVRDFSGRIIAALNISGPALRIEKHIPLFVTHLLAAAASLRHPDPTTTMASG
ncbi:IclR family transcriptional regulator C-terminal domain-containing protein [Arthrobacter sp. CAN_C5]|uniref:IclR family transcriptional regulator domain-containing protein n=1 Tax=Arthrobacter sp. CAN_C5 TaxID=2760706 RepID=UPI0028AF89A1|nr:IclR family transcriptional regulator C-terminal domain-containing protein [Arthrobacter sp. CAN_C5]